MARSQSQQGAEPLEFLHQLALLRPVGGRRLHEGAEALHDLGDRQQALDPGQVDAEFIDQHDRAQALDLVAE
jgi:hypothetical protein